MTNKLFISKLADTLGEDFMLSDMIHQEDLFKKQDEVARIIVDAANKGNDLAHVFVTKWPRCFSNR